MPHAERANTACFLEEVIKYVESLRNRNAALERMIKELQAGGPAGGMPAPAAVPAAAAVTNPTASMSGAFALPGPAVPDPQQAAAPGLSQVAEHKDTSGATSSAAAVQQSLPVAAPAAAVGPVPAAPPAAAAAAAPSTTQALMGLQGLLPEGIDVQTLLQQALINAQAQLLQQHQQHQAALAAQGASSGGAPAASAGAGNSSEQQQSKSDHQHQRTDAQQSAQPQQHGVLQSPPGLVLQPVSQPPSLLSALAGGSQAHQDMLGAARSVASATSPSGLATTLPPDLQKLKAQIDSAAAAVGGNDLAMAAGFAGGLQATSSLLAAAPSLSLSTTGAGLPGAVGGPGSLHMGRSQLLAAAAAAANGSGMGGMNGAALMAGLSAVAAAGAADNAAAIAVAERANSMASGHEEGEEGENAVPHKKRKMLVL